MAENVPYCSMDENKILTDAFFFFFFFFFFFVLFELFRLSGWQSRESRKLFKMAALDTLGELNRVLDEWDTGNAVAGLATSDPIPKLKRYFI